MPISPVQLENQPTPPKRPTKQGVYAYMCNHKAGDDLGRQGLHVHAVGPALI